MSATIPEASLSIQLISATAREWTPMVLSDFDHFLIDHAACERKASATGINFLVQYPDRVELIEPMIRLAREELLHFHQVSRLMIKRGVRFRSDEKTPYINGLLKDLRTDREARFLDRLVIFGIAEARGHEKFSLIAKAHPELEIAEFYERLAESEARHYQIYIDLACFYFETSQVENRLQHFLELEDKILKELPLRAAVH